MGMSLMYNHSSRCNRLLYARIISPGLIGLVLSLLMVSCNVLGPPPLETRPVSLYNPGKTTLHPNYSVYHSADNERTLFFRVFCREVLFNQANPENEIRGKISIDYKLYSSYADRKVEESGTREFTINREEDRDVFSGSFKLPTVEGKSYFLELTLNDKLRESSKLDYVFVDRYSQQSQQNYIVLSFPSNEVGFEKFYYSDEKFRIISNHIEAGRTQVSYYKPVKVLPPPPFTTDKTSIRVVHPDSTWEMKYDQQSLFQLQEKGVYQFFLNNDLLNALYLVNFGDHYPHIKSPEDMAPPLQYITTSAEYKDIIRQKDLKGAVDDFWVKTGKDFNNARELLKVFYNRVLFANLYYTTDREGWKTDRGMIYLLLGPPAMVKKTETREEWSYQSRDSRTYYRFEFTLESDPIKVYDFVLKRSEEHRNLWNAAVQTWRDGRIFSL